MKVDFKFNVGESVRTPFGTVGLIDMAAIDDSGKNKYYVVASNNSCWLNEDKLKETIKEEKEGE